MARWYAEMESRPKARAKLDMRMTYLRHQPREKWVREPYDTLRDGIGEVRFKAGAVWYRPLGFFGPGRNEFTFLLFATKTNALRPPNAIDIAVARRNVVVKSPTRGVVINRWGQK